MYKIIIVFSFFLFSCNPSNKYDYTLSDEGGGLYVEQFDSSIIDDNKYTENNTVYRENNRYSFNYIHISKQGERFNFDIEAGGKNWVFNKESYCSDTTVTNLSFTIVHGLSRIKELMPDYNQTVIRYVYTSRDGQLLQASETGLIENEKNIWMHPPRVGYFTILEINPFPYIQAPYELHNSWEGGMMVGEDWGDERWATWRFGLELSYYYEITNIHTISTAFGEELCYEVTGIANSKLGRSKLVSQFSFKYGFMKLDYTNIDSSKTIIELTGVSFAK